MSAAIVCLGVCFYDVLNTFRRSGKSVCIVSWASVFCSSLVKSKPIWVHPQQTCTSVHSSCPFTCHCHPCGIIKCMNPPPVVVYPTHSPLSTEVCQAVNEMERLLQCASTSMQWPMCVSPQQRMINGALLSLNYSYAHSIACYFFFLVHSMAVNMVSHWCLPQLYLVSYA